MAVRVLRAKQSFMLPGHPYPVAEGDLYRSDDPRVKGREQLFVDVYDYLGVEQATAQPGQKRKAAKPKVSEPKVEVADGVDSQEAFDAPSSDS
jgi:hypothetical protein